MPELNPLSNEQIFLKKIAENTGSNYNTGDVSEINPLTIDQILLREIAANTAGQAGDISELEEKVTDLSGTMAANGAHNLLPFDLVKIKANNTSGTWNSNTYSLYDVDFTFNDDGSVAVSSNGATNDVVLIYSASLKYASVGYKMSGCPADGGANVYRISLVDSGYTEVMYDTGAGGSATLSDSATYTARIIINSGAVINATFKPLIKLATDPSTEYTPYAMTNRELTERVEDISSQFGNIEIFQAATDNTTSVTFTGLKANYRNSALFIGNGNGTPFMAACALYSNTVNDVTISDTNLTIAVSNITSTGYDLTIGGVNTWGYYTLMVFYTS